MGGAISLLGAGCLDLPPTSSRRGQDFLSTVEVKFETSVLVAIQTIYPDGQETNVNNAQLMYLLFGKLRVFGASIAHPLDPPFLILSPMQRTPNAGLMPVTERLSVFCSRSLRSVVYYRGELALELMANPDLGGERKRYIVRADDAQLSKKLWKTMTRQITLVFRAYWENLPKLGVTRAPAGFVTPVQVPFEYVSSGAVTSDVATPSLDNADDMESPGDPTYLGDTVSSSSPGASISTTDAIYGNIHQTSNNTTSKNPKRSPGALHAPIHGNSSDNYLDSRSPSMFQQLHLHSLGINEATWMNQISLSAKSNSLSNGSNINNNFTISEATGISDDGLHGNNERRPSVTYASDRAESRASSSRSSSLSRAAAASRLSEELTESFSDNLTQQETDVYSQLLVGGTTDFQIRRRPATGSATATSTPTPMNNSNSSGNTSNSNNFANVVTPSSSYANNIGMGRTKPPAPPPNSIGIQKSSSGLSLDRMMQHNVRRGNNAASPSLSISSSTPPMNRYESSHTHPRLSPSASSTSSGSVSLRPSPASTVGGANVAMMSSSNVGMRYASGPINSLHFSSIHGTSMHSPPSFGTTGQQPHFFNVSSSTSRNISSPINPLSNYSSLWPSNNSSNNNRQAFRVSETRSISSSLNNGHLSGNFGSIDPQVSSTVIPQSNNSNSDFFSLPSLNMQNLTENGSDIYSNTQQTANSTTFNVLSHGY